MVGTDIHTDHIYPVCMTGTGFGIHHVANLFLLTKQENEYFGASTELWKLKIEHIGSVKFLFVICGRCYVSFIGRDVFVLSFSVGGKIRSLTAPNVFDDCDVQFPHVPGPDRFDQVSAHEHTHTHTHTHTHIHTNTYTHTTQVADGNLASSPFAIREVPAHPEGFTVCLHS